MPLSVERYWRFITSRVWHERRKRYFAEHGRRCDFCGEERWVELHHHTYERMGRELDDDLVAVCRTHHQEIHDHHRAHPELTLTAATRAVAGLYCVEVVRRRPRGELSKREIGRRRRARRAAARGAR